MLTGVAAIIGPLLGGLLSVITDWRGIFTVLAGLGGATFVLQDGYRLTPQQYSYVFAAGSVALVIGGFLSGRLSARHGPRALLPYGLAQSAAGGAGILATALLGLPLPVMIISIVALTGGAGVTSPPATALALAGQPQIAGTAASLLGLTRYAIGAVAAPLAGVAGGTSAVPLGLIALGCTVLAGLAALLLRGTVESAG